MLRDLLAQRRWRFVITAAALAAVVLFAWEVRAVFPPFVLALVIAYALEPPVEYLHRRGLRRAWAILLVYALVGLLTGALIVFVLPVFIKEVADLSVMLPKLLREGRSLLTAVERRFEESPFLPERLKQAVDGGVNRLEAALIDSVEAVIHGVFNTLNHIVTIVVAPVLAFYMLNDLPRFRQRLELMLPGQTRTRVLALCGQLDRVISGFVRGQLLVACFVGLMTAVALTVVGVPFAVLLGIIAALTDFIPYFGPLLGALPGVIMAATVSFGTAFKTALAYAVIQQVESLVLVPRIMGETVGLHPLVLVFALLAGGHLFGLTGLILAVPAAGILRVLAVFLYRSITAPRIPAGNPASHPRNHA